MKTTALLDMDGVLADFMGGYHELVVECGEVPWDYPCPRQYDLDAHYNLPAGTMKSIISEPGFFNRLYPTGWARWLVGECENRFDEVAVVTAYHPSIGDKKAWLQHYFPSLADNLVMTSAKHLLARPGAVLFDDMKKNCDAFIKQRCADDYSFCGAVPIQAPYNDVRVNVYDIFTYRPWNLDRYFPRRIK
jgi:5'(3')-deoxyribonucleotidase